MVPIVPLSRRPHLRLPVTRMIQSEKNPPITQPTMPQASGRLVRRSFVPGERWRWVVRKLGSVVTKKLAAEPPKPYIRQNDQTLRERRIYAHRTSPWPAG